MCQITVKPEYVSQTKVCKQCGNELPLTMFTKRGIGYSHVCNRCRNSEKNATEKFKDFTSRELIDELRYRGYEGILTKKIIETVKL